MTPHDWPSISNQGTNPDNSPCINNGMRNDCLDDLSMGMLSNPWSLDVETMSTLLLPPTYDTIYGSDFDILDPNMDVKQRYCVDNSVEVDLSWNSGSDMSVLSL